MGTTKIEEIEDLAKREVIRQLYKKRDS